MDLNDFRKDTLELVHEFAGDDRLEVFSFNLDSMIALAKAEGRKEAQARVAELEARVADIKKCLVQWRCHACGHELLEVPTPAFGPCPACGIESPYHHLFSDDRDALIQLLIYH